MLSEPKTKLPMRIRTIKLNRREAEAFLDSRLRLRLMDIRESLENGTYPEIYLDGPDADTLRDIWDDVFKTAGKAALAYAGHERLPAYTDDTVELLIRDGGGRVEGSRSFMYTDVRLKNGLYRIYKDSIEFGDGAVRLLDPAGVDSVVTGLEEDELAGFLLAFDALVPMIGKKLKEWGVDVTEAARRKLASRRADRIAQVAFEEMLGKRLGNLGIGWQCSVGSGMVDLILCGPQDDTYFEIPVGDFPAFLEDPEVLSGALRVIGARA